MCPRNRDRISVRHYTRYFYQQTTLALYARYKGLTRLGRFKSADIWFDLDAPHTKLNKLESMRLTLYGSERIQVTGYYTIKCSMREGQPRFTVDYKWVTWTWHDHGDLHGEKWTQLKDGSNVKDADFKAVGIGKPFPIRISWTDERATWRVITTTGAKPITVGAEHVAGWPTASPSSMPSSGGR